MIIDPTFLRGLRIFLLALAGISLAYALLRPAMHPVARINDADVTHVSSWNEAVIETQFSRRDILFHVQSPLPVDAIQLYVDDCVLGVRINGREMQDPRFPYCNWFDYLTLKTGDALHAGSNAVTVTVRNDEGTGKLVAAVARASWLWKIALASFVCSIAAFGAFVFRHARTAAAKTVVAFVTLGTVLRVFYFAYVDYDMNAYDWGGHLEYMQYMADQWRLPPGDAGWEFHQQPLYYMLGGAVLTIVRALHLQDAYLDILQCISLLLSLGTLCACGWIATLLFPEDRAHAALQRFVFLGLLATLPGLIMFSSRINNDVPLFFFAALCIGFLLSWWKSGSFESWALMSMALSFALLTKSSGLPLLAMAALALLLRPDTLRTKAKNGALLAGMLLLFVGWTFLIRVYIQDQAELVPVWVTPGLRVKNFVAAYTTFNPWQILMHPFNHNWIDDDRRQYLWEYFFRSAFFGEWNFASFFGHGATVLLSAALLLIPVWAWGVLRSIWKPTRQEIVLVVLLAVSLLALTSFRFLHPNSSNQELRYIAFVTIPIAYFLARGIATLRYTWPLLVPVIVVFACSSAFAVLAAVHAR